MTVLVLRGKVGRVEGGAVFVYLGACAGCLVSHGCEFRVEMIILVCLYMINATDGNDILCLELRSESRLLHIGVRLHSKSFMTSYP